MPQNVARDSWLFFFKTRRCIRNPLYMNVNYDLIKFLCYKDIQEENSSKYYYESTHLSKSTHRVYESLLSISET